MADIVTRLGVVIFPGFALLDVAGPMQFFNKLSSIRPFELSVIATTMAPVSTVPPPNVVPDNQFQLIGEQWLPTHTFDNAPQLDILLIPGGLGVRDEVIFNEVTSYIKKQYSTVKYLLSVCTGSLMLAGAGILDGRKATSNKAAWSLTKKYKTVHWVPKARWVVDDNIWSSSGVAAGMDMAYAFISTVFSPDIAKRLAEEIEYEPHTNSEWDPFAEIWKATSE